MSDYNPFFDDVKERNAMKSGAFHKVNGSKRRRCTLPSDNLTPAQKRKMNGPVVEWNIHRPMTYQDFKKMPTDLQQAHLDHIYALVGIGRNTISRVVFGLSNYGLSQYMDAHGLKLGRGLNRPSRTVIAEVEKWLDGGEDSVSEPPSEDTVPSSNEPTPEPAPETCAPCLVVKNLTSDISGAADDVLRYISAMLGGRIADVHIEINFKENEK